MGERPLVVINFRLANNFTKILMEFSLQSDLTETQLVYL